MADNDQFLATALNITENPVELIGWEPVTCDFNASEAIQIQREFQSLSQGARPVKLVLGSNGRYTIWERQPFADRWPVEEFLNSGHHSSLLCLKEAD